MLSETPAELFSRFVRERRTARCDGFQCEPLPHLTRHTPNRPGLEGLVLFADLHGLDLDREISAQVAHFAARGFGLEWKLYDFERPPELRAALLRHGFVPGPTEAFMVYPLAEYRPAAPTPHVTIQRLGPDDDPAPIVGIQETVRGESFPWLPSALRAMHRHGAIFLAHVAGRPVGTGWIDFAPCSDFATLHGGSVLPEFRGCRIYTALFEARAKEAVRRGVRYLSVDAAPLSRPILLRRGFHLVCETTPFHHAPPAAPSAG